MDVTTHKYGGSQSLAGTARRSWLVHSVTATSAFDLVIQEAEVGVKWICQCARQRQRP